MALKVRLLPFDGDHLQYSVDCHVLPRNPAISSTDWREHGKLGVRLPPKSGLLMGTAAVCASNSS